MLFCEKTKILVQNFCMLKNKCNLTLYCKINTTSTPPLHNASEKFLCHKKIGSGLIFCIFTCVASILIAKDDKYEKTEKNAYENIGLSVQRP